MLVRTVKTGKTMAELTLYNTNGIGMNAMLRKARVLLAQSTPRSEYIAEANSLVQR